MQLNNYCKRGAPKTHPSLDLVILIFVLKTGGGGGGGGGVDQAMKVQTSPNALNA